MKINAKAIVKLAIALGSAAAASILTFQAAKTLGDNKDEAAQRSAPEDDEIVETTASEETEADKTPEEEEDNKEEPEG